MSQSFQTSADQNASQKSFISQHIFQIIALVLLVLAIGASGKAGAIQAFKALVRFIWPFLALWFVFRFFKSKVSGKFKSLQEQVMKMAEQQRTQAGGGSSKGPVIDLCPQCGTVLGANHRCNK